MQMQMYHSSAPGRLAATVLRKEDAAEPISIDPMRARLVHTYTFLRCRLISVVIVFRRLCALFSQPVLGSSRMYEDTD